MLSDSSVRTECSYSRWLKCQNGVFFLWGDSTFRMKNKNIMVCQLHRVPLMMSNLIHKNVLVKSSIVVTF